jgi:hypothetical protein
MTTAMIPMSGARSCASIVPGIADPTPGMPKTSSTTTSSTTS